jgi:hypothetical protein
MTPIGEGKSTIWEEMIVSLMYQVGEAAGSYSAPYRYPFSEMDREEAIRVMLNSAMQPGVVITLETRFYSSWRGSCPPWHSNMFYPDQVEYKNLCDGDR